VQWEHLQDSLHGYKNQSLLLREPLQPTMPLNKADDTPPLVALRHRARSQARQHCAKDGPPIVTSTDPYPKSKARRPWYGMA
jgi:hypothetical protein